MIYEILPIPSIKINYNPNERIVLTIVITLKSIEVDCIEVKIPNLLALLLLFSQLYTIH